MAGAISRELSTVTRENSIDYLCLLAHSIRRRSRMTLSKLEKTRIAMEYDLTLHEVKKRIKRRTIQS